jgi:phage tail sheath protein FI
MAFLVSPGVQVREIDVSNVVPAVSSSIGGYVGSFSWGPVDEVRTITSEKDLVSVFGEPSGDDTYLTSVKKKEHFYSAANFLKYGNNLKVVRAVSTNMLNASTGSAGLLVKNATHYYDNNYHTGAAASNVGDFVARCVGVLGNSLKVSVCASANAFSQSAATTVNDSSIALGDTSMTVASGAALVVGDIITFGTDTNKYKISEINTNAITFALASDGSSGLQTVVANSANVNREWEFASSFTKAPGSSPDAIANSSSLDEIHIAVIDEDGLITGIVGEILEIFEGVSMASDAKDSEGNSNYFVDKLRYNSNYIFFSNHNSNLSESGNTFASAGAIFDTHTLPITQSFTNGTDGYCLTSGQKKAGIETYLGDAETQDVDFLISGPLDGDDGSGNDVTTLAEATTQANNLIAICEARKDCMAIISPRKQDCVNNSGSESTSIVALADTLSSSSYAVMDSAWCYQYDKYTDNYCYIPACGHTAGIMARSDQERDAWFSPAGFNRGQILGITKLSFNPNQAERDALYKKRVNPIVTFPGQGTVLFGDKTLLSNASAFDRINVRRLFIVMEKAIATAAKFQLFEFNDAFTRAQFRATIEPFLRQVKGRRGIVDFQVVCDDTNNSQSVVDANQFQASIFVKPNRSINFITLNFVAARSGVEFEEVYGATNTQYGN